MNAFYKVKVYENYDPIEHCGITIGNDEGDIMNKTMSYYGREDVEQITFWFNENYGADVVDIEDFKECPLFDLK